jgi:hypothetical protein
MIAHYNQTTTEESIVALRLATQSRQHVREVVVRCPRIRLSPRQRAKSLGRLVLN